MIELLIVISIIAILATVAIPVTNSVMNKARSAAARNDCMQIQNAIKGFEAEYFTYPVRGQAEGPYRTDSSSSIMDVLMANNTPEAERLNRRNLALFEPSKLAKTPNNQGFHAESGRFNDPWGQPYEIYIDADDNQELTIPAIYSSKFGRSGSIRRQIFVHSGGPDKDFSTVVDNVTSWDS